MKKRILFLVVCLFCLVGSFSFSNESKPKIGLVMSTGGLGSGFNKMAFIALDKLKKEGKIKDFKYIEPNNIAEDIQFLDDFSSSKEFDLVIGMGTVVAESMKEIQKKYPNQKYALIGATSVIPNTITVDFAEHEISFLAGALAAMTTKTGVVGTIPAMSNKSFNRFVHGFAQGAKYVNKDIKVLNTYMPTSSSNPFNDPVTGKNIALIMNDRGADVLFHIAELTGSGIFEAAKDRKIYAIGCDEDEDEKMPGVILTSVRVRIDNAVYRVVEELIEGIYKPGYTMANVKTDGVSLTEFKYTKDKIGKDNLEKLEKIRKDIANGKIKVSE